MNFKEIITIKKSINVLSLPNERKIIALHKMACHFYLLFYNIFMSHQHCDLEMKLYRPVTEQT